MHLAGEYRIVELNVEEEDWLANKTLATGPLRDEGVVVLAIKRTGGTYLGAPTGETKLVPGDVLVLYGRAAALAEIDERRCDRRGDQEHAEAVAEQSAVEEKERKTDEAETVSDSRQNSAEAR